MTNNLSPKYERYNRGAQDFEPTPDLFVVSLSHIWEPVEVPEGVTVFCDVGIYDIEATMIRALANLRRGFPGCYARVFDFPHNLRRLVEAEPDLRMMVEASITPMLVPSDFAFQALEAGCAGAIVDELPGGLAEAFPDAMILRRAA